MSKRSFAFKVLGFPSDGAGPILSQTECLSRWLSLLRVSRNVSSSFGLGGKVRKQSAGAGGMGSAGGGSAGAGGMGSMIGGGFTGAGGMGSSIRMVPGMFLGL